MNAYTERKICFVIQAVGSMGVSIYFCNSFINTSDNKCLFAVALIISLLNLVNICLIHLRFLLIIRRVQARIAVLPETPRMTLSEIDQLPTTVYSKHSRSPLKHIASTSTMQSYQNGSVSGDDKLSHSESSPVSCGGASQENDDDDMVCSICLVDFAHEETLVQLACCHCYHKACISLWLVRRNTCPLCAVVVTVAPANHHAIVAQVV